MEEDFNGCLESTDNRPNRQHNVCMETDNDNVQVGQPQDSSVLDFSGCLVSGTGDGMCHTYIQVSQVSTR